MTNSTSVDSALADHNSHKNQKIIQASLRNVFLSILNSTEETNAQGLEEVSVQLDLLQAILYL